MKHNLVQLFLAFTLGIMAASGVLIQNAQASNQPRMDAALGDLRAARHELEAALHDKGGHRVAAIRIVDNAIDEVKAGIAADD